MQLLEGGVALALLATCALSRRALPQPGMLFLVAAAGYATARLLLQRARVEREYAGRLDIQSGISVTLIVGALSGLAFLS